jgi:hypothetical protein
MWYADSDKITVDTFEEGKCTFAMYYSLYLIFFYIFGFFSGIHLLLALDDLILLLHTKLSRNNMYFCTQAHYK